MDNSCNGVDTNSQTQIKSQTSYKNNLDWKLVHLVTCVQLEVQPNSTQIHPKNEAILCKVGNVK